MAMERIAAGIDTLMVMPANKPRYLCNVATNNKVIKFMRCADSKCWSDTHWQNLELPIIPPSPA